MEDRIAATSASFLDDLRVGSLPPCTTPFDPGYDPSTTDSHIRQSAHMWAGLKLSMASWLIARPEATEAKIKGCHAAGVPVLVGGGPFEIATNRGLLDRYLDLCWSIGIDGIEAGEGFTTLALAPRQVVDAAGARGLSVQFELGQKHGGPFRPSMIPDLVKRGQEWLEAGARNIVIEARESAVGVGLFDESGNFDGESADRLMFGLGPEYVTFEAPTKLSQFTLLRHFGREVRLSNVRLEEVLRVEIYRRGLHADSFGDARLGLAGAGS